MDSMASAADTCVDDEEPMDIVSMSSEPAGIYDEINDHSSIIGKHHGPEPSSSNVRKLPPPQDDSSEDELVTAMAELACMHKNIKPKLAAAPCNYTWVTILEQRLPETDEDPLVTYSSDSSCDQFF
jgi:hypothetical protein